MRTLAASVALAFGLGAPWSIATAERTYDPTVQQVVPVDSAVIVTYVEAYDPITQTWIGR